MKPAVKPTTSILMIGDDEDDCLFFNQALLEVSDQIALSCIQTTDYLMAAVDGHKPSLIFIDFHLPKRRGLDCLKQLKSHP